MRPPRYHILAEEAVAAPTAGLDTASADTYVPSNRARVLTNFLPGRAGKLPLRGPVVWSQDLSGVLTLVSTANSARKLGGWTFTSNTLGNDDRILVTDGSGNGSVVEFQDPPSSHLANTAFVLPTAMRFVNEWANAAQQFTTDCSYARLGSYVFGLARANGGGASAPIRWDGGVVAGSFTESTHGPLSGRSIATWLDRIFVLGGDAPANPGGRSGAYPGNVLFWTDPAWDGTDTLAVWQDDVTGLVNKIVLNDESDEPLALAVLNRSLLILRRHSIYAVTGTSPANFDVRPVAHVGCVAAASVVVSDSGVYFMSDAGYMVYDGATVRCVSQQINDPTFAALRDDINGRANTSAGLLDADHLLISGPQFTGILNISTDSWMTFTLDGISSTNPALVGACSHPFVITNTAAKQRVCLLDHVASPELAVSNANTFQDFGTTAYGGTVESRIIELGSPEAKANLHRILLDSKPLGTSGFTATIEALDGTVLKTVAIPTSANNWVQRTVADLDGIECDFVRLKWSLTSATGPAEIQDARIEFQHEQQRTG